MGRLVSLFAKMNDPATMRLNKNVGPVLCSFLKFIGWEQKKFFLISKISSLSGSKNCYLHT